MPKLPSLTDRFAARIRSEILSGRWDGKALPSERELGRRAGISRVTVRRGLKKLCAEGLIEARPGRGYFVKAKAMVARSEDARAVLFVRWSEHGEGRLDALHLGIARGAMEEARRIGLDLYITVQDAAGLLRDLDARWGGDLRGILLDRAPPYFVEKLLSKNVPFVIVDDEAENMPTAAVIQDNAGGMRLAMEHIAGRGHGRIGLIVADIRSIHARQRVAGYREYLLRASMPFEPALVAEGSLDSAGGRTAAARLLDLPAPPTAVFVTHRDMLGGAVEELNARDLACPRDISLAVWGRPGPDEPAGELTDVTFVTWDREEMGRLAVRALEQRIAAGIPERMTIRVGTRLEDRGSVGPPAGHFAAGHRAPASERTADAGRCGV
ncbi:MAG: GntR family transcriptional regulator [Planctomycetota bacterium]|nr:GntR family transcriptional regulator [Planctomycetota bacterium]